MLDPVFAIRPRSRLEQQRHEPPSLDAVSIDEDPAGLQTGANTRLEKESERLVFLAAPEVAQLFRAVLATVQRRLERIRGRPCTQSDARHHQLGVHQYVLRCTGVAPDGLRFALQRIDHSSMRRIA